MEEGREGEAMRRRECAELSRYEGGRNADASETCLVDTGSCRQATERWRGLERAERVRMRVGTSIATLTGFAAALGSCIAIGAAAPAALAAAEVAAAPSAGAPGLPDGRVYEQVSPDQKNGGFAGALSSGAGYALAAASGEALLYRNYLAPFGQTSSGTDAYSISQRTPEGWSTRSAVPGGLAYNSVDEEPKSILPSADFTHTLFTAAGSFVTEDPPKQNSSAGMFLAGPEQEMEPRWLTRPEIAFDEAKPQPGKTGTKMVAAAVGASSDLGTVFFVYQGTLLAQDSERASHDSNETGPAGFYEWHEGKLGYAGSLPDGKESPWGAVPAATGASTAWGGAELTDNEAVEEAGSGTTRALFVSPQPEYATQAKEPSELYMRVRSAAGTTRTVLVSREEDGEPAAGSGAETAIAPMAAESGGTEVNPYAYAAPDGRRVFFESRDVLAKSAGGQEPSGAGPWLYEFDAESEKVTWLPDIAAPLFMASSDGSSFIFERREAKTVIPASEREKIENEVFGVCEYEVESGEEFGAPYPTIAQCEAIEGGNQTVFEEALLKIAEAEGRLEETQVATGLALWSHGQASEIASLPESEASTVPVEADPPIGAASTLVLATKVELAPGSFNNTGGYEQVYRYALPTAAQAAGQLSCISCAPAGMTPTSGAALTNDEETKEAGTVRAPFLLSATAGSRGIADEGRRVFFDTAQALVPDAVNGQTDVYEWEQAGAGSCPAGTAGGCLYLISPGTGAHPSFFLDNSESGEGVFFATADGLVEGDTDEAYDVYDARVGGGFPKEAEAASCAAECRAQSQGPSLGSLLTAAPGPSGNLAPPIKASNSSKKAKPKGMNARKRKLAKALKGCRKKHKRRQRKRCERLARKRYDSRNAHKASRDVRRRG